MLTHKKVTLEPEIKYSVFILLLLSASLVYSTIGKFLIFHLLVELLSSLVGIFMCLVATISQSWNKNKFLLYLGIGYFWVALADIMHALAYEGMGFMHSDRAVELWMMARTIEAFTLATASFYINSKIKPIYIFLFYGLLTLCAIYASFNIQLPVLFSKEGGLTDVKIYWEYGIIAALITASIAVLKTKVCTSTMRLLMFGAITLSVFSELCFTLYDSYYGWINIAGHILKLMSFWLLAVATIVLTLTKPMHVYRSRERALLAKTEAQARNLITSQIQKLALENNHLEESLKKALMLLFNLPWIKVQEKGAIFLFNKKSKELEIACEHNIDPELVKKCSRIALGECLCGTAAETMLPVFADCINEKHSILPKNPKDHGHYCIPILDKNKLLGVLTIYLERGHKQNQNEIKFLESIANSLAILTLRKRGIIQNIWGQLTEGYLQFIYKNDEILG